MSNIVDIYVDGSYSINKHNIGNASWAYIVIKDKEIIYQDKGVLYGEINKLRQIGGELQSVIEAVKYCIKNKCKGSIYFDYLGLRSWVYDIFGKTPWKCNNKYTKEYREFILENQEYIHEMIKVKSHSKNKWNDAVDKLAKI